MMPNMTIFPMLNWHDGTTTRSARWRSGNDLPPPARVCNADDTMTADAAFRLASEGTALLWQGDFHNARQLLQAMARRVDAGPRRARRAAVMPADALQRFNAHRQAQSQRARTLGMLLIPMTADYTIPLRRAPDVRLACEQTWGLADSTDAVVSLRELQGLIGAFEWRRKGVPVPALQASIHPHYGVFAPVRGEYVELVANAPLLPTTLAFDIGTGTGVLAAVLATRGVAQVVATDLDARAVACARDNLRRLGLDARVSVVSVDLFPPGRAGLVVCNPPWLPARPSSALEHAVYDPDSRMLRGFLSGLAEHLTADGEGWLILSDLAEHLGLRSRAELLDLFASCHLQVVGRIDIQPSHPRVSDHADALHAARAAEVTSLWRLKISGPP
jgi:methylase of polypeptide subunit release factors